MYVPFSKSPLLKVIFHQVKNRK